MLEFAEALTLRPGSMQERDVDDLRQVGFFDCAIHDIVQVTALFAYYNRLADGLAARIWTPLSSDLADSFVW